MFATLVIASASTFAVLVLIAIVLIWLSWREDREVSDRELS